MSLGGQGVSSAIRTTGSGFLSGADVSFENGAGPAPDVRVTNPDESSAVLAGFTVTRRRDS